MKKFLLGILQFFVVVGLIILVGIFLPVTPKASNYLLFSKKNKDLLLQNVISPRIIFIGGSNLIFGLDSQMIKDSLNLNPINAGSAASVGLIYMLDNTLPFIKEGDLVVISPEYQHFYGEFAYGGGGNDLMRMLMDVEKSGFLNLRAKHWPNLIKPIPNYFISKFQPSNYFNIDTNSVYGMNIFNEYGDSFLHLDMNKKEFNLANPFNGKLNNSVINELKIFENELKNKKGKLFITYPCYQAYSYERNLKQIIKVEEILKKNNFNILGDAKRYSFSDSFMFDSPYHLTRKGVNIRTKKLIEDIKEKGID